MGRTQQRESDCEAVTMIRSISDFERLETPAQNSLNFLRRLRDAVGRDLEFDLNTERAAQWIEDMVLFKCPDSGFEQIKNRIMQGNPEYISQKFGLLKLLQKLCNRVARLEREGCHVPREYWHHDLLNPCNS